MIDSVIGPTHFITVAALLFGIGAAGAIWRRNALMVLMSIELMLNAANIVFVAYGRQYGDNGSHAIAFFIAKGLLDAGADFDNRFTPPSFQSMRNTVDAVRADAGHLLLTLHRENPFAPAARLRFVQALQDLNATLSAYEAEPADSSPQPGEPTIPESPRHDSDLKQTRNHIDELDMELVALLARRAQLSRRAGRAKVGRPVRDPLRETELLKSRRQWADDAGLNPDNMEEIFQAVLRMSRQVQVDMR